MWIYNCWVTLSLTQPTGYELRENNRLVGHWDEISGDGEIYPDRIGRKK
jgi:hypothetical protein